MGMWPQAGEDEGVRELLPSSPKNSQDWSRGPCGGRGILSQLPHFTDGETVC